MAISEMQTGEGDLKKSVAASRRKERDLQIAGKV
jgi:hypothetical protein